MPQPLIAITGATGAVGGLVAERLADAGREPPTDRARCGGSAEDCRRRRGDRFGLLGDRRNDRCAEGADTLFLVSGRESENRLEQHYSAIDAAVAAGVSRMVYTSFCGAAPTQPSRSRATITRPSRRFEQSGMAFVFQRQNLYTDFLPFFAGADGIIRGPAATARSLPSRAAMLPTSPSGC